MQPYKPQKLPPKNLDWLNFIPLIGEARDRLSKFDGLLQGIPNPTILLSPLTTQEAVVSSRIEGTQATLEEVLEYEADPKKYEDKKTDIKEILNYRRAMLYAVGRLEKIPLTINLMKKIHEILLENIRSNTKKLGEFRDWQVYIGQQGTTIKDAEFIPPESQFIPSLMSDLGKYIHVRERDPLVQLAIIHAQFEIIHPFGDGNGRVGRIIMPLFLFYKKVLTSPMFYLSAYFELNRNSYYKKLNNISAINDWNGWIKYFLNAVKEQSELNILKAKNIINLHNLKKEEIREVTKSKYAIDALDFIFSYPFFTTPQFSKKTKINENTAKDLIRKLEKAKVIHLEGKSTGRKPNIYSFRELLKITG